MKKLIVIALSVMMLFAFTACSGNNAGEKTATLGDLYDAATEGRASAEKTDGDNTVTIKNKEAFEAKLDQLFSTPFAGYEADNMTGWFGQYCVGNQPSQGISYYYYFVGKPEKAQEKIDIIMNDYYAMGKEKLAYAGMDDEGSLSAWYVMNAMGLYSFSPADAEYIVTVPIFDKVEFTMGDTTFTIIKKGVGRKLSSISYDGKSLDGYFIKHDDLRKGKELVITTCE